jgi:catechol 2,3-dioxygenase-like lactoylglutathione lyase family enzyme
VEIGSLVIRVRDIEKVSAFYERVGLRLHKKYQNDDNKTMYEFGITDRREKTAFQSELYLLLTRMEIFIGVIFPPLASILVHKVLLML